MNMHIKRFAQSQKHRRLIEPSNTLLLFFKLEAFLGPEANFGTWGQGQPVELGA